MNKVVERLSQVQMFSAVPEISLAELARLAPSSDEGGCGIRQGDTADVALKVALSASIAVEGGKKTLGTIAPGEVVGEQACSFLRGNGAQPSPQKTFHNASSFLHKSSIRHLEIPPWSNWSCELLRSLVVRIHAQTTLFKTYYKPNARAALRGFPKATKKGLGLTVCSEARNEYRSASHGRTLPSYPCRGISLDACGGLSALASPTSRRSPACRRRSRQ